MARCLWLAAADRDALVLIRSPGAAAEFVPVPNRPGCSPAGAWPARRSPTATLLRLDLDAWQLERQELPSLCWHLALSG